MIAPHTLTVFEVFFDFVETFSWTLSAALSFASLRWLYGASRAGSVSQREPPGSRGKVNAGIWYCGTAQDPGSSMGAVPVCGLK